LADTIIFLIALASASPLLYSISIRYRYPGDSHVFHPFCPAIQDHRESWRLQEQYFWKT